MRKMQTATLTLLATLLLLSTIGLQRASAQEFQEWGMVGPYWDYILFPVITNPDAQYLALKKGEIDHMLWYIPTEQIDDAVADPDIAVATTGDAGFFYLAFNFRKSPTDDLAFRKAMAHCIDKEKIVSVLLKGMGVELWSVVPPLFYGEWSNPDVVTYDYDPQLANQTLLDAGWTYTGGKWYLPDGTECPSMDILTPSYDPVRVQAGVLIAEAAQTIGLPITSSAPEFSTLVDLAFGDPATGAEPDFLMYILGWGLGADPDSSYYFFHSSQSSPFGSNTPGIANATLDKWLEDSLNNMTKEEVMTALYKAQEIIGEQLPYAPLYERLAVTGARNDTWTGHVNVAGSAFGLGDEMSAYGTKFNVHLRTEKGGPFGGTYRAAMLDDMKTQNPIVMYPLGTVWDAAVLDLIYETMITVDPTNPAKDLPQLAWNWTMEPYEWTPGEEGMKITFELLDNVTWHDGVPLNASDVKFSIEYAQKHRVPEWLPMIEYIYDIDTPDEYTVVFYCNQTKYWAIHDIGGGSVILPKHIWEDIDDPMVYPNDHPIGSGPALWVNRVPGEYVLLRFNPNYYRLPAGRLAAVPELEQELYQLIEQRGLDTALLQTEISVIRGMTSLNQTLVTMQSDLTDLKAMVASLNSLVQVSVGVAVISLVIGVVAVVLSRKGSAVIAG